MNVKTIPIVYTYHYSFALPQAKQMSSTNRDGGYDTIKGVTACSVARIQPSGPGRTQGT